MAVSTYFSEHLLGNEDKKFLLAAALNDADSCVEALENGANPNTCEEDWVTALHVASEKGFVSVLEAVVSTSRRCALILDLDCVSVFGQTPLVLATENNHPEAVGFLLRNGADPNKAQTFGRMAIHRAAFLGRVGILMKLLQYRADVNATDCFDQTPLCHALTGRHDRMTVKHLLRAGADPNFRTKTSMPLLSVAVLGASQPHELMTIRFLIRAGADVRAFDGVKRDTALHKAALTGFVPAIDLLVRNGGDLFAENTYGETPLNIAIKYRNLAASYRLYSLEEEYEQKEFTRITNQHYMKVK